MAKGLITELGQQGRGNDQSRCLEVADHEPSWAAAAAAAADNVDCDVLGNSVGRLFQEEEEEDASS